jgi:hypothetical protein
MEKGLTRLFLILLLVCEWAGDPHFGRTPRLSWPMQSEPVCCPSLRASHDAQRSITSGAAEYPSVWTGADGASVAMPSAARPAPFLSPAALFLPNVPSTPLRC